ncbi:hypothetical protein JG687_00016365 [Phytophthora cactorum]|uniref:Uncharacterized protein n=1 Tax=Phytophthora cactorum TaxID=29920 RepID=A0A8T1TQW4_9STRA|nr:hypothetical protein JG687_00016365 [Phytophthora cactorum]
MRNTPLHKVEGALTRTVKACLKGLTVKVDHKLEKDLGTLFGQMFDGWSHAGVHYVAIFAVYEADGELRVPLRGLFPLADGSQTADAHVMLFENIFDVYNKTNKMVGFLVDDNCTTN